MSLYHAAVFSRIPKSFWRLNVFIIEGTKICTLQITQVSDLSSWVARVTPPTTTLSSSDVLCTTQKSSLAESNGVTVSDCAMTACEVMKCKTAIVWAGCETVVSPKRGRVFHVNGDLGVGGCDIDVEESFPVLLGTDGFLRMERASFEGR